MSAKKIITKRDVGPGCVMGKLQLPDPSPSDEDTLLIEGFSIHARFGDIFAPVVSLLAYPSSSSSSDLGCCVSEWVPLMSNYPGGQVLGTWIESGGHCPNSGADIVCLKDGDICLVGREEGATDDSPVHPSIKHAIAYRYARNDITIAEDIELIAKAAPKNSLLVIPAIGTNNGISFAEAANRFFYSIVSALNSSDSPLRANLRGILFTSPIYRTGSRTISHIINLFNIYRATRQEPECPVCFELKQDTVTGCGHRFCGRCVLSFLRINEGVCPICRNPVRHMSPCYKFVDATDFKCCDRENPTQTVEKAPFVFVPCGHINALCSECSRKEIDAWDVHTSGSQCKVCGNPAMGYLRIYS